jgi:nitroreductase
LPFNKRDATHSLLSRRFSSASIDPEPPAPRAASSCEDAQDWELTDAFQNLLMTRRTSGKFAVPSSLALQPSHWKDALERAVRCGRSAPNHKRTEPFAFKRMISPSLSTERLADIAYEVSLREQREKKNGHVTDDLLRAAAARKRDKWSQIPAFLVTLCASSTVQDSSETNDPYTVLPYIAPQSERELEDYAATCAAVQNILLSLHSEHLATKWATGPVIRTPAFRQLVEACPTDRVVALIMVGMSDNNNNNSSSSKLRQRRQRRVLHGDVLVDL